MAYMLKAKAHQLHHMVIIERIPRLLAVTAAGDDSRCPEYPELMADGGGLHSQRVSDISDPHFSGGNLTKKLYTGSIPQHFEQVRQISSCRVIHRG